MYNDNDMLYNHETRKVQTSTQTFDRSTHCSYNSQQTRMSMKVIFSISQVFHVPHRLVFVELFLHLATPALSLREILPRDMPNVSLLQRLWVATVHVPQKNPGLPCTSTCHCFLVVILQWIVGAFQVQMQRITLTLDISREVKGFRLPFKAFQPLIATQEIEVETMVFPPP